MAIKFNVHEIGNPSDPTAPKKFYARPVHTGEVTLEELAADISHASSITESDVYAVLQSLIREIPRNISRGYIVRLRNMGSFRVTAKSTGSDLEEEVTTSNIFGPKLLFHPGRQIKSAMQTLVFKKNGS
ncbi:HU family DNA-binding protein [Sphingobacterium faecale]|uniref:HU family DNA-binding protein n=1 Tax=Sphingobacterium faecale TaxID=2803775 RepID=A0ABS1R3U1_9SPHI|nr:HU family DNA-binding protein [Sphingobacterium faecale]MBL1409155.1 HU family DNA-binding protein [Sphingobacterium faecale]